MGPVALYLKDLAPLFGHDLGSACVLITAPSIRSVLRVELAPGCETIELSWTVSASRLQLVDVFRKLEGAGRRFSALWIADDEFEHYYPDELGCGRLGAISYFSGGFSPRSLERCLEIIRNTDYMEELKIEADLLDYLDRAVAIRFRSSAWGTEAVFAHRNMDDWFSLHGNLNDGQQVVLPTGELSTLTNPSGEYSFDSRFPMSGEIVLKGGPVVHRGGRDVSAEETGATFETIASMFDYPVIASVRDGLIENVRSATDGPNPFLDAFVRLLATEPRYRKIHEIGFGTNRLCARLERSNFFPNERYPGVHFGLGLGGFTQFHLDLVCTDIEVFAEFESGELIDIHRSLGLLPPIE
jgi:hypothetical protein